MYLFWKLLIVASDFELGSLLKMSIVSSIMVTVNKDINNSNIYRTHANKGGSWIVATQILEKLTKIGAF